MPDSPVLAAMQPIQSFVTADEMCAAIEHLVILAEGALTYADVDYSMRMARLADQIMDRLLFEQSLRVRSDLVRDISLGDERPQLTKALAVEPIRNRSMHSCKPLLLAWSSEA